MVELIEILDKRKDGDRDEYYFTVSYKGNKYKVMFKDWWFGNKNKGCYCENIWDSDGNELYKLVPEKREIIIDDFNKFDMELDDLFWSGVYGMIFRDLEKVNLKIDFLKSFDDEDYYEFEDFENYEINNLNFKLTDGDMYEVTFDVKVTTSYDNWKNADENFKKNAIEGRLEVEFSLEDEDKLFFNGEDFQKEYDGLTKLILNKD